VFKSDSKMVIVGIRNMY